MKHLFVLATFLMLTIGCETENPICTNNYCVTGEIFSREELGGRDFQEAPETISEDQLLALFTEHPNEVLPNLDDTDDTDDIFYINGVIQYINDENTFATMDLDVDDPDLTFSDNWLVFSISAFDAPELMEDWNVGERRTVKVRITAAYTEISKRNRIFRNIWVRCRLIEVIA